MLEHLRDLGAQAQPHAVHVDVEARPPVVVPHRGRRPDGPADAGVVDGDVEAAEARDDGGDGGLHRGLGGDVDDERQAGDAPRRLRGGLDLGGHGAQRGLVDVGEGELADAVLGEAECGAPPDACRSRVRRGDG